MTEVVLRLFVAGDTPRSQRALRNVGAVCDAIGAGVRYDVVDVARDPATAEAERVLTTPMLVRESPAPARRVVGDLSDVARVLDALGLPSPPTPAPPSVWPSAPDPA